MVLKDGTIYSVCWLLFEHSGSLRSYTGRELFDEKDLLVSSVLGSTRSVTPFYLATVEAECRYLTKLARSRKIDVERQSSKRAEVKAVTPLYKRKGNVYFSLPF